MSGAPHFTSKETEISRILQGVCFGSSEGIFLRLKIHLFVYLVIWNHYFKTVNQFIRSVMSDSLQHHGLKHANLLCPSPTPNTCSNSCPSIWWCHLTLSSSVAPFSSCLQSFSASGSFPMSQFFASHGQSIGASASASVLSINIQGWFPLGWTGWISLQSKGLSEVFSNTTVQKHQFFKNCRYWKEFSSEFQQVICFQWPSGEKHCFDQIQRASSNTR